MTCPDRKLLEDLALGLLPESDAGPLRAHLLGCPACQREAVFDKILRLGLSGETPSGACLDDETLCQLHDGNLPEPERERAVSHVAGCLRCASALRSLGMALLEAEHHPQDVPPALLDRAAALATPRAPKPEAARLTWLQRLLQGPLFLRLSVAGAAAALMLLVAFLFYPAPPAAPRLPRPRQIAIQPPAPRAPEFAPKMPVGLPPESPRVASTPPAPAPATPPAEPRPTDDAPPSKAAPAAETRVAVLLDSQRRILHDAVVPVLPPGDAPVALGFAEARPQQAWRGAYLLGRTTRSLAIFASPALAGSERSRLRAVVDSLPALMQAALAADAGREVLLAFVDKIESALDDGDLGAARARLEVLQASLSERLEKNPAAHACFALGTAVSRLLLASAQAAYRLPTIESAQGLESELAAARRRFAEPIDGLAQEDRDRIRTQLEALATFPLAELDAARARTLIAELKRLDRAFETAAPAAPAQQ